MELLEKVYEAKERIKHVAIHTPLMKNENLSENSEKMGSYIEAKIQNFDHIKSIRRRGLMIGIELDQPCAEIRINLLTKHHVFTGNSNDPNVLRILPALNITEKEADIFIDALKAVLQN